MTPSLRRRLLLVLLTVVLSAWTATAVFTYLDARHEIDAMLDARLAQSADLVAVHMALQVPDEPVRDVEPRPLKAVEATLLQVWRGSHLMLRSGDAPDVPLSEPLAGYSDAVVEGQAYRVYSRPDEDGRFVVQVAERTLVRRALAESVASHLLHPLYFAVPALGLLIWLSVGIGLAPLGRFAREVEQRAPDNLAALDGTKTPSEVLPLQVALNALFERLGASFELERRFTADAAHELKTPLAAIRVQAQVARHATQDAERRRALNQVIAGVDRAGRLVEQLLVLARLDPQRALQNVQPVGLLELARDAVTAMAPYAAERSVDLGLCAEALGTVQGDPVLLGILLRNLLDNAVRYTPQGGRVDLEVLREEESWAIRIADTGPGIPREERSRVFERFYRVLGNAEPGSGLGLSIVQHIATLHDARLILDDGPEGKGLSVTLSFPPLKDVLS